MDKKKWLKHTAVVCVLVVILILASVMIGYFGLRNEWMHNDGWSHGPFEEYLEHQGFFEDLRSCGIFGCFSIAGYCLLVLVSYLVMKSRRREENTPLVEMSASVEDFEYTFGPEIRGYFVKINGVALALVYYGFCAVVILLGYLQEGYQESDLLVWGFLLVFMPLMTVYIFKPEQKLARWIQNSRCRLSEEGVYLQILKEKIEFVPWEDFVAVERQQMNLDRGKSVYVICCYRSLTAKTILEHTPTGGTKHLMHRVFYQHRNEIVTLGYDKKRMARIRALRGTGMSKSEKIEQLQNHEWSAYESNRDL